MARRFFWLSVVILFALTAYTGGWYWAADRLVQEVQARTGDLPGGRRVECLNPQAKGFPFRIGLYCDRIAYGQVGTLSVDGGALRSAAQVYNPFQVVAETDGPARLLIDGLVPLEVNWANAQASARLAMPLPELVSTDFHQVAVTAGVAGAPRLLGADRFQVHMRPAGADIEVGVRFEALKTGEMPTGGTLAPLGGMLDVVWKDGVARLGRAGAPGSAFTLRNAELVASDGARLSITGSGSIGDDRLLDADLVLTAENVPGVTAVLAQAFPEAATQIASLSAGLSAMGERPSLPVTIRDGAISLGFIPVGFVPAL
jgi:hypothetical protein